VEHDNHQILARIGEHGMTSFQKEHDDHDEDHGVCLLSVLRYRQLFSYLSLN